VDSKFVNVVQSALRTLAVCPACGRRIDREEGVRLHGERYHRGCVYYGGDPDDDR
jgi:predicted RNA-binding Zn-ribbon protein involved in translation (DUF1610 family)